jgi:hypothetical protein
MKKKIVPSMEDLGIMLTLTLGPLSLKKSMNFMGMRIPMNIKCESSHKSTRITI